MRECFRAECQNTTSNAKFCSRKCSAIVTNSAAPKRVRSRTEHSCAQCQSATTNLQFCSRLCASQGRSSKLLSEWLAGELDGSKHLYIIKNYLRKTRGDCCELCGWSKVHPETGIVPVQLDHVNGDWQDNTSTNLRLLCPNCHSLTETYGFSNSAAQRLKRGTEVLRKSRYDADLERGTRARLTVVL